MVVTLSGASALCFGVLTASLTGLGIPGFEDGGIELGWRVSSVPSSAAQQASLDALLNVTAVLATSASLVCALTLLVLALAHAASGRAEAATRAALGATRRRLVAWRVSQLSGGFLATVSGGALAGLLLSWAARGSWPGVVEAPPVGVVAGGLSLAALAVVAALCGAALLPLLSVERSPARSLRDGGHVAARYPTGLRWLLAVVQIGLTAGLVTTSALLVVSGVPPDSVEVGERVGLVSLSLGPAAAEERATLFEGLLRDVRGPGGRSVGAATPGALVGLGRLDLAIAECGNCYIGGMFVPLQGVEARHHALAPDTFEVLGGELIEGREFGFGDRRGSPPVALVNRALVAEVFHDGSPVGKHIRLAAGLDSWYEVVGVVEEPAFGRALGGHPAGPAVYVSALQHPPFRVDIFVADGVESLPELPAGVASIGPALPLAERLAEHAGPLTWAGRLIVAVGFATLASALFGVGGVMAFIVGRRRRELGVRVALGASPRAVHRFVLSEAARLAGLGALVGVWIGFAALSVVRELTGAVPDGAAALVLAVCAGLSAVAVASAVPVARSASRDEARSVLGD